MSSNATAGAVVFAKNLGQVARFYEGVLGAQIVHEERDHVVLAAGPVHLVIHAVPEHVARHIDLATPPNLREEAAIKPFFRVPSLAQARVRAAALDGGLMPVDREWSAPGFRVCDGWDPEGNVVQFRENAA